MHIKVVMFPYCAFSDGAYYARTPHTQHTNITLNINPVGSHFIFEVMSSTPVHIYLATDLAHYRYGFEIGRNNNETLLIRYDWPEIDVIETSRETPGILDAREPRFFWVSWHEGVLSLGKGKTVNQDILLKRWSLIERIFITSIGLRSAHHTIAGNAEWTFDKYQGLMSRLSVLQ